MTKQIPTEIADRLKLLLKPIADMFRTARVTIIVRASEGANSAGDFVFTADNPTKVLEVLKAHMTAEAQRFAAEGARSGQPDAEFPKRKNLDEIDGNL